MTGVVVTVLLIAAELILIGLAAVGVWALVSPRYTERQRLARHVRRAEADITEVGRRAQVAIMAEMLRQLNEPQQGGSDTDHRGRM